MKQFLLTGLLLAGLVGTHVCAQNKAKPAAPKPPSSKPANISTGKDLIQTVPDKLYDNLKAGDIAPDAVKIDCDFIGGIKNGAILIRKGNKSALIDVRGNFLAPWGKYNYLVDFPSTINALIHVQSTESGNSLQTGFINSKGEVVLPPSLSVAEFNSLNVAMFQANDHKPHFVDERGNVFPDDPMSAHLGNGGDVDRDANGLINSARLFPHIYPITVKSGSFGGHYGNKYGFTDRNGKPAFEGRYDAVGYFCDGMARVLNVDQFGVAKWGFIDETGKLVIPYTYRIQPGNFHDGLAMVSTSDMGAGFDYAFIDKTGAIQFKIGDGGHQYGKLAPSRSAEAIFIHGVSFWNDYNTGAKLLDRQGNFKNLAAIIRSGRVKSGSQLYVDNYTDKTITYHDKSVPNNYNNGNIIGVVDFDGNELFPPVYSSIKPDYFSSYAWAKITLPNTKNVPVWPSVEGIVNKQGVFVVVLDKKPSF